MNETNKHVIHRYKLWFSALIQVGLLAGAAYGWANLELMLKREGYWKNADDQDIKYGLVYTVGSWFSQAGRVFIGIYLDHFGVKVTTVTCCFMVCAGMVLLAVSNPAMNLIYPSFILMTFGGPGIQLSLQSVSNLFENKAMVISSLSWAFQLSTLWFMVCNILNESGVDAFLLYTIYAAVAGILGVHCLLIYPKKFNLPSNIRIQGGNKGNGRRSMLISSGRYHNQFLETGTLWQMVSSKDYIFLNIWYMSYVLVSQFYIMTVGAQTELATGKNMATEFTITLSTVSALGIGVGYVMDKLGFGFIVFMNTVITTSAIFCITSPVRAVHIIGFILYVLARTTTWCVFFSFIGINFGFKFYGTLVGMGLFISGCFSAFQYYCLHIIKHYMENNYNWMNMFFVMWCALWGGLYTLWLFSVEEKGSSAADIREVELECTEESFKV